MKVCPYCKQAFDLPYKTYCSDPCAKAAHLAQITAWNHRFYDVEAGVMPARTDVHIRLLATLPLPQFVKMFTRIVNQEIRLVA